MKLATVLTLSFTLIFSNLSYSGVERISQAAESPHSQIIVYRPGKSAHSGFINYRLYLDGQSVGRLKAGAFLVLDVKPGEHRLLANDKARSGLSMVLGSGDLRVLKSSVDRYGKLTLNPVDPGTALAEAPYLAEILRGDLSGEELSQR